MASTTFTVINPALLGTVITAKTGVASSQTITISPDTEDGNLDTATLMVRISAVGGSVTPTILCGTTFSSIGQGNKALTAIASSASALVGGATFEGARFINSSGNIVIQMAGTGTASIEAFQKPHVVESS